MNITEIVFSPTGGTQKVVDAITEVWGGSVSKVDLTNPKTDFAAVNIAEDDIAVIAVPSYGGRVPALASERLGKIHGDQAKCILVCVYGNRAYEDTLVEMQDVAEKSGFKVIAAICAIAEHSIMHQFAAGRPDQKDKDELHSFAQSIMKKIEAGGAEGTDTLQLPGNRPYKEFGGVGMVPKANNRCNGCGICADNCPAEAISKDNLKSADKAKCISCMRCVVQCPQGARKLNGVMLFVASLAMKKVCSGRKENELYI